ATPFGFAITIGCVDTIGNVPLLPLWLEPDIVSHWPTAPDAPLMVIHGELTGAPLVAGTHTPPTFCPGEANDPGAAVPVVAPVPLDTSTRAIGRISQSRQDLPSPSQLKLDGRTVR